MSSWMPESGTEVDMSPDRSLELTLLRSTIEHANLDVGIFGDEAKAIARYYLLKIHSRRSVVTKIDDRGSRWEVQLQSGPTGTLLMNVSVDKHTGRVTSFGERTVENLQALLQM